MRNIRSTRLSLTMTSEIHFSLNLGIDSQILDGHFYRKCDCAVKAQHNDVS